MQSYRTVKSKGFTLLEILVSLSLIAFIVGASFYFSVNMSDRHRLALGRMKVDRALHDLVEIVSEDLSCIILIDKGFPVFEFANDRNRREFIISFFSSNNEEHVTKMVQYRIKTIDDLHKSFTKFELSSADSLLVQSALNHQSSLHENFSKYTPNRVSVLGDGLLDFNIRAAIRTPSGGIFVSPTNKSLTYDGGCLHYKKAEIAVHARGMPLFMDITVRALTETTERKLSSTEFKSKYDRALFLASEVRKSFRRIALKSSFF
ncbi:MAG: prepilin-type N-terminal cleavage/methylation domain-containing protein [Puniceicoccales bacterium]|jgi:prepilin-type N-terminal cleavage/methylation domain-containing protein|nr:prepilin-type N-terminal cleavage/methylation domain-containing protein [Puniceicoccales bacterium]